MSASWRAAAATDAIWERHYREHFGPQKEVRPDGAVLLRNHTVCDERDRCTPSQDGCRADKLSNCVHNLHVKEADGLKASAGDPGLVAAGGSWRRRWRRRLQRAAALCGRSQAPRRTQKLAGGFPSCASAQSQPRVAVANREQGRVQILRVRKEIA